MKALIVEDMPAAAAALKADLEDHCPGLEVAAVAGSVLEGARLIKKYEPELLFLDIEMGDGDGFDLLDIVAEDLPMQVIFTTGSREHAVKAFRYAAVDYLLKPVDPQELKEAVERARKKREEGRPLSELKEQLQRPDTIALSTQEEIRLLRSDEIIYCKAESNYCMVHYTGGKTIVSSTLKRMEEKLAGKGFLRVHQSWLVNFSRVRAFLREEGGYLLMDNGDKLPVSSRKKALVLKQLDQYL